MYGRSHTLTPHALRLALLGVFAFIITACTEDKNNAEKPAVPVTVQTVETSLYSPALTMTGEIEAHIETDLAFRVSGRIVERMAETGQRVRNGDLLARIEPEEQRADMAAADASLKLAQAQEAQSLAAFNRSTELLQKGLTTRGDHDTASAALISARNAVEAARSSYETSREALGYTELRADADGIVTARSAEVGQVAQAAQMMFKLARDGDRDAVFHVQESIFLRPDAFKSKKVEVDISLISLPGASTKGVIREISPTIDPATGTVRVKAGLYDPSADMALGAAVTGRVTLTPIEVITVPWTAIGSLGGNPAVWVLNRETLTVSLQAITVYGYEKEATLVSGGLKSGMEIVSEGAKFLREGQKVRILGETKS